jgi:hypothetical protein
MRTLILVPIYKRPEITDIWAKNMQLVQKIAKNVDVLTILSPEDEFFNENSAICEPFTRVIYPNEPLGRKMNAGVEYALRHIEWDYLMNLGSDDLLHPLIFKLYENCIDNKVQFFGLDKVYFFDMESKKLGLSKVYVWGAGRMIHRRVIEDIRRQGGTIYTQKETRSMDCDSINNIKLFTDVDYSQVETDSFPYIVDLKTNTNLNDFTFIQRLYELVDNSVLNNYPDVILKLIL